MSGKSDGSILIDTKVDQSGLAVGLAALGKAAVTGLAAAATAVVGLGAAAIKVGSEYEVVTAKVSTMFGDVAVDTKGMQEQVLALSSKTGLAAAEVGDALYEALSAGIPVTKDMTEAMGFVAQATALAKGGFTTTAGAVDVMTTALNAYGLGADQAAKVSDILITTQNLGKTTVDEMAASLGRVLPAAAAFQVGLADVGASMAIMTAGGIQTAESTTYLKSIINELGKDGSKVADILKEKTGQSFAQLMASGASLGDVMGVLQDSVNGDATAFANLWSSQEAGIGALAISRGGVEAYNKTLDAMENSTGAAADAAAKMSDTLETNVAQMTESAKNLGIAVYQDMQEPLKDAAKWAASSLQQMSTAFNEGGLTGLADAVGDVLAQAVARITQFIPDILSAATSVTSALLQGIQDNLPDIIPALVESGASFVDAIVTIAPQMLAAGLQLISSLLSGIAQKLPEIIPSIISGLASVTQTVIEQAPLFMQAAVDLAMGLIDGFASGLETLGTMLPDLLASVASGIQEIVPLIVAALPGMFTSLIDSIVTFTPMLVDAAVQFAIAIVDALPDILTQILGMLPGLISGIVGGLMTMVPQVVSAGIELFVALVKAQPQIISAIVAALPNLISGIIDGITTLIPMLVECGVDLFVAIVENLPAIIGGIVAAIPAIIDGVIEGFKGTFGKLAQCGKDIFDAIFRRDGNKNKAEEDFVTESSTTVAEAVEGMGKEAEKVRLAEKLRPKLEETTTAIAEWGSGVIDSAKTTFDDTVSSVATWGSNLATSVSEAFPQFIESAKEWLAKLPEEMAFQLGAGIGHLINFGVALFTWVTTAIPAAITAAIEWFASLPGKIWETLTETINKIREWEINLFNSAVEAGTNFITGIIDYVKTLPEQVSTWLTSTLENVASWATELLAKAVETASSFLESIITYVKQLPGKIADQLTQAWNNVVSWAQDLITTAATKIPEFAQEVLDAISSLPGDFLDVGADIVSGLWRGIRDGWNWLTSKVRDLAKSLLEGVKSTLGINSPSKEFAYLGKMSSLGLAVGFDENADKVLKSVNDVANRMIDTNFDIEGSYTAVAGLIQSTKPAPPVPSQADAKLLANVTSEDADEGDAPIIIEHIEIKTDKLDTEQDWDAAGKALGKAFRKKARLRGVLASD